MRFLVRIAPVGRDREGFLSMVRSISSNLYVQARNPKWTSYGALEIDLFARSKSDFDLLLSALEPLGRIEFSKALDEAPPHRSTEEAVSEARALFRAERYWECHEVLEGVWRNLEGEKKVFVQGVILVCAAFVHHQKGNDPVALSVLKRAERQLARGGGFMGIRPDRLRREVSRILESGTFRGFEL